MLDLLGVGLSWLGNSSEALLLLFLWLATPSAKDSHDPLRSHVELHTCFSMITPRLVSV